MALGPGFPFTVACDDSTGSVNTISDGVNSLQFATPRGVQDITGVSKSAIVRQLLLADFNTTLALAAFDDAAGSTHLTFRTVSSTSVARTLTLTVSANVLANEVLFTDYQLSRGNDGSLTASVPGVLANGVVPTWA